MAYSGKFTVGESQGVHANVESCVAEVFKNIARPPDTKSLDVEYSFVFDPGK